MSTKIDFGNKVQTAIKMFDKKVSQASVKKQTKKNKSIKQY